MVHGDLFMIKKGQVDVSIGVSTNVTTIGKGIKT